MSVSSVQFYGIDSVIGAYTNYCVAPFALWAGKTLLLKYDGWNQDIYSVPDMETGVQLLNDYMNAMYQGSSAIYTLKVYEDLTDKQKIKPSTEYSTAFNFKLGEPQGTVMQGGVYQRVNVYQELQSLRDELNELRSEEPSAEQKKSFVATITGGMVEDTAELKEIIGIVKGLFFPSPQLSATMAGTVKPAIKDQSVSAISSEDFPDNEKTLRISQAIIILQSVDSRILEHLELLARIAQSDPSQFKQFIMILDSIEKK